MEFDVFCYTNQGGRGHNEDYAGYNIRDNQGIFIVADGLGGHSYGELASSSAVNIFLKAWEAVPLGEDPASWLTDRMNAANQAILSLQEEYQSVLKSTAVCLTINGSAADWAHVGDSRLYYIHNSDIRCITADHSVAYKKFKAGEISRTDINNDEDQSSLLRSLGGTSRNAPELTRCPNPLEPGDAFFLCTDGAWEYLYDEDVLIDLLKARNAHEWCELLLLRIMGGIGDGRGNDNLTLLTLMLK